MHVLITCQRVLGKYHNWCGKEANCRKTANWWKLKFRTTNSRNTRMVVLRQSINVSGRSFSWVYFLIKYQFPSKLARRPYFYKLTVILPLGQLPQGQKYHMSCHEKNKICVDLTQVAMQPMATWARLTWGWVQLILMWWVELQLGVYSCGEFQGLFSI